jgi:hypothetical protein
MFAHVVISGPAVDTVHCGRTDLPLCARRRVNNERRSGWVPNLPKYTRGVLGKYAKVVQSAAHGVVCG